MRPADPAALDVADGPHAQAGSLRELLLGKAGRDPAASHQFAEPVARIRRA
jgi:hypothetical protein